MQPRSQGFVVKMLTAETLECGLENNGSFLKVTVHVIKCESLLNDH